MNIINFFTLVIALFSIDIKANETTTQEVFSPSYGNSMGKHYDLYQCHRGIMKSSLNFKAICYHGPVAPLNSQAFPEKIFSISETKLEILTLDTEPYQRKGKRLLSIKFDNPLSKNRWYSLKIENNGQFQCPTTSGFDSKVPNKLRERREVTEEEKLEYVETLKEAFRKETIPALRKTLSLSLDKQREAFQVIFCNCNQVPEFAPVINQIRHSIEQLEENPTNRNKQLKSHLEILCHFIGV